MTLFLSLCLHLVDLIGLQHFREDWYTINICYFCFYLSLLIPSSDQLVHCSYFSYNALFVCLLFNSHVSSFPWLWLQLEENICVIALSGDWVKLVDGWSVESSVIQSSTNAPGSTQKCRPGRHGRTSAAIIEVIADDD